MRIDSMSFEGACNRVLAGALLLNFGDELARINWL